MVQLLKQSLVNQLRRQSLWLKDSWLWLLRERILKEYGRKARALEVGCGPGFVIELLAQDMEISGIDIDDDMVKMCRARGLDVKKALAEDLPFEEGAFDIVYCSFLLLWVKEPSMVLSEMSRVSKRWIVCLAEPDYGARIDHPGGLSRVSKILAEGIRSEGGDPFIGRKLRSILSNAGLESEIGVHPGIWNVTRLREEFEGEWSWVEASARGKDRKELQRLKSTWIESLNEGTLFQYNPIFYAIGMK